MAYLRIIRWLLLLAILLPLGLFGTVANLASASVLLLLVVFAVVNGALSILKGRKGEPRTCPPRSNEVPKAAKSLETSRLFVF